ncbi:MAG: VWA domain-containing protein, partial [Defluviitaleaceae bacterium]|nr:VWA domain-containing protein [Defluviitaleaceae bacterium]
MMPNIIRNIHFGRIISILLIAALLFSNIGFISNTLYANNIENVPFSSAFNMLADPDTSIPVFNNTPAEDGRIWTDKSVNIGTAFIYDIAGRPVDSVSASADEFLVTLSALGQSFSVDAIIEPSDTVFIIDVSASMYINRVPGTTRSRIDVLVEALNVAIQTILDANPNNRISVVAYGGGNTLSRTVPILRLGHPVVTDGNFFTLTSPTKITVSPQIPDTALFSPDARVTTVEGGTPTQRGIFAGANILLNNMDTTYTAVVNGETIVVTRRPNIILMTDGAPTIGWSDYRFLNPASDTNAGNDLGNNNNSDMGLSVLTVLTASYMKQLVQEHYYGTDNTRAVGFFTIGFGDTSNIVAATMNPYGSAAGGRVNADLVSQSLGGVSYNMRTLLDNFAAGQTITFPALSKGSASVRELITVSNPNNFVVTNNYTNLYFSATGLDDLKAAFSQISQQITSTGSYSTYVSADDPDFSPDFDGYLIFSDVIGDYM